MTILSRALGVATEVSPAWWWCAATYGRFVATPGSRRRALRHLSVRVAGVTVGLLARLSALGVSRQRALKTAGWSGHTVAASPRSGLACASLLKGHFAGIDRRSRSNFFLAPTLRLEGNDATSPASLQYASQFNSPAGGFIAGRDFSVR